MDKSDNQVIKLLKTQKVFYSYDNGVKKIDTVLDNLDLNIKNVARIRK